MTSPSAGAGTMLGASIGKRRPRNAGSEVKEVQKKIDKNIAAMIRADVVRLKERSHGIRDRLYHEYGLAGREAANVSIEARSGGEVEAFRLLKEAWLSKYATS